MTIQEFARMLHNRYERSEITKEEAQQAKELGYVVIFGHSDDNMELRGAIDDEVSCFDGGKAYITMNGLLGICDSYCEFWHEAKKKAHKIEAVWNNNGEYNWTYETTIPHAVFDILDLDEGDKWCRGIVFDINNLSK